jgi:oligopeptide transport system ATP-binding protein
MRLLDRIQGSITSSSSIIFEGQDILRLSKKELLKLRGGKISMIFQDSMTSLNPTSTVGKQITENIRLHMKLNRAEALARAEALLGMVEMPDPKEHLKSFPHQLSGGMRQRVMISMALSCHPRLLIADEPTTALDLTIQAQLLDLLRNLKETIGMSIIMVTHDLGIVADFADRIQVMYAGSIVETGLTGEIFTNPRHPYTLALLKSVPVTQKERKTKLYSIKGTAPDLLLPLAGCPFAGRCDYCMPICRREMPGKSSFSSTHSVFCWLNHERAPKTGFSAEIP